MAAARGLARGGSRGAPTPGAPDPGSEAGRARPGTRRPLPRRPLSGTIDWASAHAEELNELERTFLSEGRQASEREAERQRRTNRRLRAARRGGRPARRRAATGGSRSCSAVAPSGRNASRSPGSSPPPQRPISSRMPSAPSCWHWRRSARISGRVPVGKDALEALHGHPGRQVVMTLDHPSTANAAFSRQPPDRDGGNREGKPGRTWSSSGTVERAAGSSRATPATSTTSTSARMDLAGDRRRGPDGHRMEPQDRRALGHAVGSHRSAPGRLLLERRVSLIATSGWDGTSGSGTRLR